MKIPTISPIVWPLCLPKIIASGIASRAKNKEPNGIENFLLNSSRYWFSILGGVFLKCILFFLFSILSLLCIYVYVTCFFTVFKNSQQYAIMNTSISIGIFLIMPIIFYILPAFFLYISLTNRKEKNKLCLYILSKILLILF